MHSDPPLAHFLEAARSLQPRIVKLRRSIHSEPEIGLDNPTTRSKILDEIADLDLDVTLHEKSSGVLAVLHGSQPGRRLLLRGDTDALPMTEETDLSFRSTYDGRMHACGHDAHAAMLAATARLLSGSRFQVPAA